MEKEKDKNAEEDKVKTPIGDEISVDEKLSPREETTST